MHRAHAVSATELDPPNRGVRIDPHAVNGEACREAAEAGSLPQSAM